MIAKQHRQPRRKKAAGRYRDADADEPNGTGDRAGSANGEEGAASEPGGRRIRTRGEAYRRLSEAADFLMRTEPHSPVPHLVRRAIAWGALSLEDLLPELVSERNQLTEIYRLLQLRSREPPK